jgi:hypothetical protein
MDLADEKTEGFEPCRCKAKVPVIIMIITVKSNIDNYLTTLAK